MTRLEPMFERVEKDGGDQLAPSRFIPGESVDRKIPINQDVAGQPVLEKNLKEALSHFDYELDLNSHEKPGQTRPETSEMILNAQFLIEGNEFESASEVLEVALAGDPNCEIGLRLLAKCFKALGQLDRNAECCRRLISLNRNAKNIFLMADVFYNCGEDQQALDLYLEALSLFESDSPLLFEIFKNIGNIYVRGGDFDAAEESYNKAYTLDPKSDTLLVNHGTLEIQKGTMDRALERFRQAVQINPDNDKAWVGLALVHREYGDHELSWGNLSRSLDANQDNLTALQLMMDWAATDDKEGIAIQHIEDQLQNYGADKSFELALATLLASQGKLIQAERFLVELIERHPNYYEAQEILEITKRELEKQNVSAR